jgi:hypothetical protein
MKLPSPLRRQRSFSSLLWHESQAILGVRYATRRVSLAQRIELTRRVRELSIRHEFLKTGDMRDQLEATLADLLTRKLYLEWGLAKLSGLDIDDQPATVDSLVDRGQEELADEIVGVIRGEVGLSEEERKNS